ncbi:MAG: peptidoglycan DD-metalloendopeptidase family protein [Rhodospirillales bacterium]|nr:MAG: peptidoglycan DD-metalloendopeptidase family protein [Rhodospirillales bacterium]
MREPSETDSESAQAAAAGAAPWPLWAKPALGAAVIVAVTAAFIALSPRQGATPSGPATTATAPAPSAPGATTTAAPSASAPAPSASPSTSAPPSATPATPTPATAASDPDGEAPQPMDRYEVTVRVEKGDTFESILRDMEFAPDEIQRALDALRPVLKNAKLKPGETVTLQVRAPAPGGGAPTLLALAIRPEARREILLDRAENGTFGAQERIYKVVPKLMRAGGVVKHSFRGSLDAAGVPGSAIAEVIRAFSWDVNFQYDVKGGDKFAVLIEQAHTTDGKPVGAARLLWAEITTGAGKASWSVYRFQPQGGAEHFFYKDGRSVIKAFLRTPMDLSRVSSRFGMRNHPIMGFTAMHTGVDFAAPHGTPILAAGAGTVAQAGPNGGYGHWVRIDHGGGNSTGYAHMAGYAAGIRPGARVRQGQVIGFVGSTGVSTGPHLHFELHQKGRAVNPLAVKATQRAALGGKDLERFKSVVAKTDTSRVAADTLVARGD